MFSSPTESMQGHAFQPKLWALCRICLLIAVGVSSSKSGWALAGRTKAPSIREGVADIAVPVHAFPFISSDALLLEDATMAYNASKPRPFRVG